MKSNKRGDLPDFIDFFQNFFTYLYFRIRFFLVVVSVITELLVSLLGDLKKLVIRYMFWGRGSWYRFLVMGGILFTAFFFPSLIDRRTITEPVKAEEGFFQEVPENDLLVERGSSQTIIDKSRPRMDVSIYTVRGGDTVSQIAEEWDVSIDTILWANDLDSTDYIKPGMEIKIPPGDGVMHKVEDGDTLSSVAGTYEASEQAIADINWIDPPFDLIVGNTLFIPNGTMPTPEVITPVIASNPVQSTQPVQQSYQPVTSAGSGRFLSWPVAGGGYVSQCFHWYHNGIDIADSSMPNLVAAAPGVVTFAGCQSGSCPAMGGGYRGGYGLAWTVVVDHGNGYSTVYAHLDQIYVYSGQYLSAGQALGRMGQTGTATGVHVHFMVVPSGTWSGLNPAQFLNVSVCGY